MAIRKGKVQLDVRMTGSGNAEAKIKGASDAMGRAGKSAASMRANMVKAGAAVAAVGLAFRALGHEAEEGRKAIRIGQEFSRVYGDAQGSMERFREAVGHGIDDTSIQAAAANLGKLGLSASRAAELIELASKAQLASTGSLTGALAVAEQTAAGRTRALAKLGVVVNDVQAARRYAAAHGLVYAELTKEQRAAAGAEEAISKLHAKFDDTAPVERQVKSVEKARTTLENAKSDWQIAVSQAEDMAADALTSFGGSLVESFNAAAIAVEGTGTTMQRAATALGMLRRNTKGLTASELEQSDSLRQLAISMGEAGRKARQLLIAERARTDAYRDQTLAEQQRDRALAASAAMHPGTKGLANALTGAKRDETQTAVPARRIHVGGRPRMSAEDRRWASAAADIHAAAVLARADMADWDAAQVAAQVDAEASVAHLLEAGQAIADTFGPTLAAAADGARTAADQIAASMDRIDAATLKLHKNIRGLTGALGDTAGAMSSYSPQISGALGGIAKGVDGYVQADKAGAKATAIIGGMEQVTRALGLNRKTQAGIEIAVQTAMSIASFADGNWGAGIGHAAAAAAWGAALGIAGGTSGSAGAGASSAASAASAPRHTGGHELTAGAGTTNIYVQGAAIGTAQQVGAVVADALGEASRSGMGGRV